MITLKVVIRRKQAVDAQSEGIFGQLSYTVSFVCLLCACLSVSINFDGTKCGRVAQNVVFMHEGHSGQYLPASKN